jgi:hypothetical protein
LTWVGIKYQCVNAVTSFTTLAADGISMIRNTHVLSLGIETTIQYLQQFRFKY